MHWNAPFPATKFTFSGQRASSSLRRGQSVPTGPHRNSSAPTVPRSSRLQRWTPTFVYHKINFLVWHWCWDIRNTPTNEHKGLAHRLTCSNDDWRRYSWKHGTNIVKTFFHTCTVISNGVTSLVLRRTQWVCYRLGQKFLECWKFGGSPSPPKNVPG